MWTVNGLGDLSVAGAHELTEAVLQLASLAAVAEHPRFSGRIEEIAVTVLADVAAARQNLAGDYFQRLAAASGLRNARRLLGDLSTLLSAAVRAGVVSPTHERDLAEQIKQTSTLVIALAISIRAGERAA